MKRPGSILLIVGVLLSFTIHTRSSWADDMGPMTGAQIRHMERMKRLCNKESYTQEATKQMMKDLLCGPDLQTTVSETRLELDVLVNSAKPEYIETLKDHVKDAKAALNDFEKTPYSLSVAQHTAMMITCVYYDTAAFGIDRIEKFQVLWARFCNHLLSLASYTDAMLPAYEDSYYGKR